MSPFFHANLDQSRISFDVYPVLAPLSARGKAEGSQVFGDVHEQAVGCLREMIADG